MVMTVDDYMMIMVIIRMSVTIFRKRSSEKFEVVSQMG